jgi:hypothetical protein
MSMAMDRRRGWRAVAALAVAVAMAFTLGACSGRGGGGGGASPAATPQARPSSTAQLAIELPKNGETVQGPSVRLKISLKDAEIVPATNSNLSPSKGHLHVYLDNSLVSMTFGLDQMIPNVPPGQHVVRVEFVASDHAPFDPRVFSSVIFEVKA